MTTKFSRLWGRVGVLYHSGSFGRVRLTRNKKNDKFYAVKILKKAEIIRLKQVDHIMNENNILSSIAHPFIVRSHCSKIQLN